MNEIQGKNVLMEVYSTTTSAYVPFVCCKDVSITITPENINKTTVGSGIHNEYAFRRLDWEVSISGVNTILASGRNAFTTVDHSKITAGYLIRLTFTDEASNTRQFAGRVLLKTATLTGNQDSFSEFDNTFQGTGAYTLIPSGDGSAPLVTLHTPVLYFDSITPTTLRLRIVSLISGATSYVKQLATDAGFTSIVATVTDSGLTADYGALTPGVTYYGRSKATGPGVADSDYGYASVETIGADVTAPFATSLVVEDATPAQIFIYYNEPLYPLASIDTSQFTPSGGKDVVFATVTSSKVILYLNSPYVYTDTITLSYSPGQVKDVAGNLAASLSGVHVTNNIAPPSTTYNTVFVFTTSPHAGASGIRAIVPATDANEKLEFNSISPIVKPPTDMTIYVGGVEYMRVTFYSDYLGQPFRFTDTTGATYIRNFISGDINL